MRERALFMMGVRGSAVIEPKLLYLAQRRPHSYTLGRPASSPGPGPYALACYCGPETGTPNRQPLPRTTVTGPALKGKVALVAGATRGGGRAIAVELARAGFFVYATGRSSRRSGPSEIGRPETIEETGELMAAAGEAGSALVVDHEDPVSVGDLVAQVEREQGRLDLLVNDIFGGDRYAEWDKPLWEHDWAGGLRMLQMGVHTHLITCRAAIPLILRTAGAHGTQGLVVEMTDGTSQANSEFRRNVGFYYDLVKANVERIVKGLNAELDSSPVTVVGVTPGWLRSEKMLENFGVTESNWRDACATRPGFAISESPAYVARGVAALAQDPDPSHWAGTIISARQLADSYGVTDIDGSKPDCWGHLAAYGWGHADGKGIEDFR
jgi:NAD(P)-dependent dehydrogenase (short-subunit alcohol dehydrogenase family)